MPAVNLDIVLVELPTSKSPTAIVPVPIPPEVTGNAVDNANVLAVINTFTVEFEVIVTCEVLVSKAAAPTPPALICDWNVAKVKLTLVVSTVVVGSGILPLNNLYIPESLWSRKKPVQFLLATAVLPNRIKNAVPRNSDH